MYTVNFLQTPEGIHHIPAAIETYSTSVKRFMLTQMTCSMLVREGSVGWVWFMKDVLAGFS